MANNKRGFLVLLSALFVAGCSYNPYTQETLGDGLIRAAGVGLSDSFPSARTVLKGALRDAGKAAGR